jgi:hypothetical protein
MTVDYHMENKKSSKKKLKASITSMTPKKKRRRKSVEDDVIDNFDDVDGDNIYAKKYVSKRGKGSADRESEGDDDEDEEEEEEEVRLGRKPPKLFHLAPHYKLERQCISISNSAVFQLPVPPPGSP